MSPGFIWTATMFVLNAVFAFLGGPFSSFFAGMLFTLVVQDIYSGKWRKK